MAELKAIDIRLTRIESRLVQLMLHAGLDPYKKKYDDRRGAPDKPKRKESG
jgi:hypothetical protein